MATRRRHGLWDRLALYAMLTQEHRSPRFVPRLGRPRPLFERVRRWRWRLGNRTWVRLTRALMLLASLMFVGCFLIPAGFVAMKRTLPGILQMLPYLAAFPVAAGLGVSAIHRDPRWVVLRRLRTAIVSSHPTPQAASQLAYRRNVWRADVISHARAIRGVLSSGSTWLIALAAMPGCYAVAELVRLNLGRSPGGGASPPVFSGWLETFFMLCAAAVFTKLIVAVVPLAKLVGRSLTENICPECGYPQPEGVVVNDERGVAVHFGPEWCSECGTPWPLVPPEPIGTAILGPREEMR